MRRGRAVSSRESVTANADLSSRKGKRFRGTEVPARRWARARSDERWPGPCQRRSQRPVRRRGDPVRIRVDCSLQRTLDEAFLFACCSDKPHWSGSVALAPTKSRDHLIMSPSPRASATARRPLPTATQPVNTQDPASMTPAPSACQHLVFQVGNRSNTSKAAALWRDTGSISRWTMRRRNGALPAQSWQADLPRASLIGEGRLESVLAFSWRCYMADHAQIHQQMLSRQRGLVEMV